MIKIKRVAEGIDISEMLEQIGIDQKQSLLAYSAETAYRYMDKYVPMSNGHYRKGMYIPPGMLRGTEEFFQESIDIRPEGKKYVIEYKQPYAQYQYFGQRADGTHEVYNYTTDGTGPYWDVVMLSVEGDDFYGELQDYIDKRLK